VEPQEVAGADLTDPASGSPGYLLQSTGTRGRGRDSGNRASMKPGAVQQVGTEPVKDREGLDRLFGQGDRGRNWARSKHAIPEEGG
jgi:hypothetical protein